MLVLALVSAVVTVASLSAGMAIRARITAAPTGGVGAASLTPGEGWLSLARAITEPDRRVIGAALWLMAVDTAISLAAPWPLQLVVDYGLGGRPFPAWLSPLAGLPRLTVALVAAMAGLILLGAGALAGYQVTYLTGALAERMSLRLRVGLISHLLRSRPGGVSRYPLGELSNRVGSDAAQVADTVSAVIETVVPEVTLLIGMTVITSLLDWRLTAIAMTLIPLYVLTARLRDRPLREAQRRSRTLAGRLDSLSADQLARLPAIHVFGQAQAETALHARAASASADAVVAALDASARFRPVNDIIPGLGLGAALVVGTIDVTSGRLTVGGLLVFAAYLASLTSPIRSLSGLNAIIARGAASKERVRELLALELVESGALDGGQSRTAPRRARGGHDVAVLAAPPVRPRGARRATRSASPCGPAVRLESVTFSHRPGTPVLDSVDLALRAGELTCLTGPSGTGKSTLLSLLIRLAEPRSGRILIGERDIGALPLDELRSLVTLVPQEPWLHSGTIAQNISYGLPGASMAAIRAAADRASVTSFAADLPDGLDTPAGEHGGRLSAGQRRRVAIARALLRDTPVLLLDEPTAGLDQQTRDHLVSEVLAVTRGRTVLLVTHERVLADLASSRFVLADGNLRPADTTAAQLAGLAS